MKTCSCCSETYSLVFFRRARTAYAHGVQGVCKGCEQAKRDARKRPRRWLRKVKDCTKSHARKLGISRDQLETDYGWDPARMEHEAEHVYSNGCPNCGESFGKMGHGLHDITLDIVDPTAAPTYGINTRWICMTCNRAKGKTRPAEYAEVQMCWNRWRNRQRELQRDPWIGTLFEGSDPFMGGVSMGGDAA